MLRLANMQVVVLGTEGTLFPQICRPRGGSDVAIWIPPTSGTPRDGCGLFSPFHSPTKAGPKWLI